MTPRGGIEVVTKPPLGKCSINVLKFKDFVVENLFVPSPEPCQFCLGGVRFPCEMALFGVHEQRSKRAGLELA
jgi:hypothetical protein